MKLNRTDTAVVVDPQNDVLSPISSPHYFYPRNHGLTHCVTGAAGRGGKAHLKLREAGAAVAPLVKS